MSLASELEFVIVTDVPFAVPVLQKHTQSSINFARQESFEKVLLPICALRGCQSFVVKYSECPVALSTLQLNLARAHLMVFPIPF